MSADDPTLAAPRAAVRYGNVVVSPAVCAAPERGIWVRRGRGPCRWPTAVFCTRCAEVGAVVRGLADVAFQTPSYARAALGEKQAGRCCCDDFAEVLSMGVTGMAGPLLRSHQ